MKRYFLICMLTLSLWTTGLMSVASACPMCKQANETDSALPRAYMVSILFMLAVPAMIVSGVSWKVYRLTKERDDQPGSELLDANEPGNDE